MKIYLNHGVPMQTLDSYGMEIESFASAIDCMSTLVEPKGMKVEHGKPVFMPPDQETVEESFLAITIGLRRIASDLRLLFEMQTQEENEAEKKRNSNSNFMNMPN